MLGGLYFKYNEEFNPYFVMEKVGEFMATREKGGASRTYRVNIGDKIIQETLDTIFK